MNAKAKATGQVFFLVRKRNMHHYCNYEPLKHKEFKDKIDSKAKKSQAPAANSHNENNG